MGESYLTFGIHVRRKHWYYFFKVVVLMWLIVLLSFPTFLFGFEELEQRVTLTATMFLATAATLYVVGSDLPKTERLNRMDKLLLGTLTCIFAEAAESIAVFQLHKEGSIDDAQAIEDTVTHLLPVLYLLLNVYLFGVPLFRTWSRGALPASLRQERVWIPFGDIEKVDPWGSSEKAKVATGKEPSADGDQTAVKKKPSRSARASI